MNTVFGILILFMTLPVSVVGYNAYVKVCMKRDLPKIIRDSQTGVIQGAEPLFLQGSETKAALLIHGYIGSPTDFGRLPELLQQAGYTVSVPLLPGHGTDPRDFSKVTARQLIKYVDREYTTLRKEYDEVILMGLSMGGALSVITSVTHITDPPDKMVLFAPYFQIKHAWYYGVPAKVHHKIFSPFVPYLKRPKAFKQLFKKENRKYMIDYDYISTKGTEATIKIGEEALSKAEQIGVPTLILHSVKDKATDYKTSKEIVDKLNRPDVQLITLNRSNHLILWDYEQVQVEKATLEFLAL